MNCCPHCGKRLRDRQVFCPACSNDVSVAADHRSMPAGDEIDDVAFVSPDDDPGAADDERLDESNMTVIARFQNAAEAGYFAHELGRSEEMPVTVALAEDYDGMHGYWSARFHLLVPDVCAERAASALERLVAESESDELSVTEETHSDSGKPIGISPFGPGGRPTTTSGSEASAVNWVPIVLTLTAGSAALWGLRQMDQAPRLRQPVVREGVREEDLWSQFLQSPDPWWQRLENGRGIRELRIDRGHSRIIIREDADGDGFFESQSVDTIESLSR
ncbi:MAG: zinc ribbon domain-containing protein [Planctomycetaceae bacterium]